MYLLQSSSCSISELQGENGQAKTVQDILVELKSEGTIEIVRYPTKTATVKDSSFWEEKDGKTVMIRRLKA